MTEHELTLDDGLLDILKNFNDINPGIYIDTGSTLKTLNVSSTIYGLVGNLDTEFPVPFAIYDLSKFLASVRLFKSPVLKFAEGANHVDITDGNGECVRYHFSERSSVINQNIDKINIDEFPEPDISFVLCKDEIQRLRRTAQVLQVDNVVFRLDESKDVICQVMDSGNKLTNSFTMKPRDQDITINPEIKEDFEAIYDLGKWIMMPDDYRINISRRNVSVFRSVGRDDLLYMIALESRSVFV